MSYGDLNEGTGLGKLDGGTDARATAPRCAKSMWPEPDVGDGDMQERWTLTATTIGVGVSQV